MTTPSDRRPTSRQTRLTRFVALVAALGQLFVAVAAWADATGDRGNDARPHVEQDGTRLHHAHAESQCALCAAQHLVARPHPSGLGESPPPPKAHRAAPAATSAPSLVARGVHLSRAPPSPT